VFLVAGEKRVMQKLPFFVLAASAVAIMPCVLSTGPLRAQSSPPAIIVSPQVMTFGMVGVAANQTARLNVLAVPMGGPIINGAFCQVTMEFFNEQGASLKTSTQTVTGGAAVHADLQRGDLDADTDRREIRGTVRSNVLLPPGAAPTPLLAGCSIVPTLEVFDQENGRTMAVLESTRSLPLIVPLAGAQ
jgi:hypothetical protein